MRIEFSTIDQGEHSGVRTARNAVVANQQVWGRLWAEHTSDVSPPPPTPPADFSDSFVVAIFSGQRPTGGYGVELVTIETQAEEPGRLPALVVTFREVEPGSFAVDVLTHPYLIVRVNGRREDFDRVEFTAG